MSDSWMAWNPRIDEPSKARPSSKTDWSNEDTGTVKCCMMPGRSQKRTSTIWTSSSSMYFSSSSLFWNIRPPWPRRRPHENGERQRAQHYAGDDVNLRTSRCTTVSTLFRACYGGPVGGVGAHWRPDRVVRVLEYASWPRRIAALAIDWLVSTLVTIGFMGLGDYTKPGGPGPWIVLGVFALEVAVLTTLAGGSFG